MVPMTTTLMTALTTSGSLESLSVSSSDFANESRSLKFRIKTSSPRSFRADVSTWSDRNETAQIQELSTGCGRSKLLLNCTTQLHFSHEICLIGFEPILPHTTLWTHLVLYADNLDGMFPMKSRRHRTWCSIDQILLKAPKKLITFCQVLGDEA